MPRQCHQTAARLLAGGVFAEELRVVFALEIQGPNPFFDLAGDASQVTPLHVAGHVDLAAKPLRA